MLLELTKLIFPVLAAHFSVKGEEWDVCSFEFFCQQVEGSEELGEHERAFATFRDPFQVVDQKAQFRRNLGVVHVWNRTWRGADLAETEECSQHDELALRFAAFGDGLSYAGVPGEGDIAVNCELLLREWNLDRALGFRREFLQNRGFCPTQNERAGF